MILPNTFLKKQTGVVLVLVALSLLVLMGVAALAIDLSHAEVDKTRLQNLADQLALSAAISLNNKESGTLPASCPTSKTSSDLEQYAEYYATYCSFPKFTAASGNEEVKNAIASTNLAFTFSSTTNLNATSTWWNNTASLSTNGATFVRVVVSPMNVSTWFAKIMGFSNMAVSASAVAGFTPIAPCDLAPFAMCAETEVVGGKVQAKDPNCNNNTKDPSVSGGLLNNNDCYGYELNAFYCMKEQAPGGSGDAVLCPSAGDMGPGNFGFLDFSDSGFSLEECLAGNPACGMSCKFPDNNIPTKTGQTYNQVKDGFNTRFNEYPNPSTALPSSTYTPDMVTGSDANHYANPELNNYVYGTGASKDVIISGKNYVQTPGSETETNTAFSSYLNAYTAGTVSGVNAAVKDSAAVANNGQYGRRILSIPFIDCNNTDHNINNKTVKVVGYGCFFMAREYGNTSVPYKYDPKPWPASNKYLYGIFVGDDVCSGIGSTVSTVDYGFYKVQLYKDPLSGSS